MSLDFINNVYSTKSNYSYTTATSTPGFSFTNTTGGYDLAGTTLFAANTPRITSAGLLVEAAATNITPYSTDGASAAGTGGAAAISAPIIGITGQLDPSGGTGAISIAGLSASQQQGWNYIDNRIAYANATVYTWSCYVKYAGIQYVQLTPPAAVVSTVPYTNYDLINGTITAFSGTSGTITNVGNGWYRLSISATTTAAATSHSGLLAFCATGTDTRYPAVSLSPANSCLLYGWQIETGSSATSLIPTTSAAVTRAADVATQTYTGTPNNVSVTTAGLGLMKYPAAGIRNLLYGSDPWTWGGNHATLVSTSKSPTGVAGYINWSTGSNYTSATPESSLPGTYTISFWAWTDSGTNTTLITYLTNNNDWADSSPAFTITPTPTRFTHTVNFPAGTVGGSFNELDIQGGPAQVYVACVQLEAGATASGYVPTNGAAATLTPSSPFTISQAPFLGQNIQSVAIS